MELPKIAAGGTVICNDKDGVIGAVIKYKGKNCILTVYHLIKVGKCKIGSIINIDKFEGRIIEILWDYDIVIAEIYAPSILFEFSSIGKPEIGPAYALNGQFKNPCNIMTTGKIYHYLSFAPRSIPLPGDSGSPIIQKGHIVGILASIFYNNATAVAVSLELFLNNSLK